MKSKSGIHRLEYLDWLRGIGATIMLHGHVWDSFLRVDLRNGGPYIFSQFLGGMPPAIFLFLTGVTLSFLMDSSERKGMAPVERVKTAFRRSGYLFFLAFAFRIQLWIFGIPAPWRDLLRVDILNCMGFAIAVLSVLASFRPKPGPKRQRVAGLGIACLSPLISAIDWARPVAGAQLPHSRLSQLRFFPWGAYLAFGVSAGSVIRAIPPEATDAPCDGARCWATRASWCAITWTGCRIHFSQGGILAEQPAANPAPSRGWCWLILRWRSCGPDTRRARAGAGCGKSAPQPIGVRVHIELVYGRELFFLKGHLNEAQTLVAAVGVILSMLAISVVKTRWTEVRTFSPSGLVGRTEGRAGRRG